jgi:Hydantoinase/oxoprolinase N-terminal region
VPASRVAVDVGGTFTDVCVLDEEAGEVRVGKVPSTADWEVDGFSGTLSQAPSGTTNLALAATLLVVLILRSRGLSGGKELAWPADWSLTALRRPGGRPRLRPPAVTESALPLEEASRDRAAQPTE